MIIPYPVELKEIHKLPVTTMLVCLNIFLFVMYFSGHESTIYSSPLLQADGLAMTGRMYQQYLQEPANEQPQRPEWVQEIRKDDRGQLGVLGAYALRDNQFISLAKAFNFSGDSVRIAEWKENVEKYQAEYQKSILTKFGLSAQSKGPLAWLTYQFSHSNWMHLLSNAIYLLFIGAAVEMVAGSGALLAVYVLGGIGGGLAYTFADPYSITPVIGASACVSALLAFYCVVETRKRVRYFYFVFPRPNMFGPIFLPTLLIVPLFLVADFASLWGSPVGLGGGIAYSAHIGGSILGILIGILYRIRSRYHSKAISLN